MDFEEIKITVQEFIETVLIVALEFAIFDVLILGLLLILILSFFHLWEKIFKRVVWAVEIKGLAFSISNWVLIENNYLKKAKIKSSKRSSLGSVKAVSKDFSMRWIKDI